MTLRERLVGTLAHDAIGVWMLAWSYAPIVGALWAFHRWPSAGTFVLAFLTVGFRMNALFVVVHESWHYNLFRSRAANEWLGAGLASYPVVMPYFKDRTAHWDHHRYVGTLRDPNAWAWDFPDAKKGALVRELLKMLFGITYLARIYRVVVPAAPAAAAPEAPSDGRPPRPVLEGGSARKEIPRLALVHAVILGVFAITIGPQWYFALWLLPALTLFPVVIMVREFLEHRRGALVVYETGPIERFLFGCFNFHLHAFHHAHASAPWFTLPAMREKALRKAPGIVFLRSYLVELVRYFRGTSTVPARESLGADGAPMPAGDVPLAAREGRDDEAA